MEFKSDIQIAQESVMTNISKIAADAGIDEKYIEQYGKYKAKIDYSLLKDKADAPDGKLVLVTAISPTPAGEGKTTTTVGLADALHKLGKNVFAALREPSLGPVFGVKGGAAGGGYAQVVRWRTSTSTSQAICTQSALQTTSLQHASTTTFSRAISSASTLRKSPGRELST